MSANGEARNLGRTPLTDPRSLVTSGLFHGLLLLAASLVVFHATLPAESRSPRALHAELENPQDEANKTRPHPGEGGGGLGEVGGTSRLPRVENKTQAEEDISRDPLAESLLDEILPTPPPNKSETQTLKLPGPATVGQGILPGTGSGGGGGSGGGSVGGVGPGIGPGTQFFGAQDHAHSFAYVIDCSGSMESRRSLDIAKRELLASVGQLPPDASVAVIFYNLQAVMLSDPRGREGLMAATRANKGWIESQLASIKADGGTDHMRALAKALEIKPEVIFFLTDADMMSSSDVNKVLTSVGSTRIQAIEFGMGTSLGEQTPLARLATTTGGAYLYIDVSKFPRSDKGY